MRFKEKQTFAKPTGESTKKKNQNQTTKKIKKQRERIIYLVCCNLLGCCY